MKSVNWILVLLALSLGLVHILCTPFLYESFNADAVWFAGNGLLLINLGLLNLARTLCDSKTMQNICFAANGLYVIYCIVLIGVVSSPEPYANISMAASLVFVSTRPANESLLSALGFGRSGCGC